MSGLFVVHYRDKIIGCEMTPEQERLEMQMVVRKGLPDDMQELLKQLVMNGGIRMAGTVLYTYCRRMYQVDDYTAARWMMAYFQREFPQHLQRHRTKAVRA
ncbi:hypothetical protein [Paenibacillus terrae]|nr:hypothetical protein [Paenibacillus terrae]